MPRRLEKRREWEARLVRRKLAGTSDRQFCLEEGGSTSRVFVHGGGGDGISVEIRLHSNEWLRVTNSVEQTRLRTLLRVMREEAA